MSSPAFEPAATHTSHLPPTLEPTSTSAALPARIDRQGSPLAPYLGAPPISQPPYDEVARPPRGRTAIAMRSRTQLRSQILSRNPAGASPTLDLVRSADQVHSPGQPSEIRDANVPGWSREVDSGVTLTTARDLPPSRSASHLLARAVIEVISGYRQLAQLRIHCAPEVFAGIGKHIRVGGPPSKLTSVHASEPADGVIEACAVFRRGHRVAALAFRLQGVDGRWRITAMQIG